VNKKSFPLSSETADGVVKMKLSVFVPLGNFLASVSAASAFQLQSMSGTACSGRNVDTFFPRLAPNLAAFVNTDENTPRDLATMEEWAIACGVQKADCFQLTSEDGLDVGVMTTQDIPVESPVLFVPRDMILSSSQALHEIGRVDAAEELFGRLGAVDHLPHFYLFLKILTEYEMGDQSQYYPWLNSLPRYYSNGASMTHFCCSECLPPLVGKLAMNERVKFIQFFRALKYANFLSDATKNNRSLAKWAFAVVYTRCFEYGNGDVRIVPMEFLCITPVVQPWNGDGDRNQI